MQGPKFARQYEHIVIDTAARPSPDELETLADGCDVLVIPCSPDALSLDVLGEMVDALRGIRMEGFKVLLTQVPPKPNTDGQEARETLQDWASHSSPGSFASTTPSRKRPSPGCLSMT